jgi:O-methyltransferase involved in polyketide biosynthesis
MRTVESRRSNPLFVDAFAEVLCGDYGARVGQRLNEAYRTPSKTLTRILRCKSQPDIVERESSARVELGASRSGHYAVLKLTSPSV